MNSVDVTLILCRILGIVFGIFGLSILINKKSVIALLDQTVQSYGILWILGFVTMVPGAILVVLNTGQGSILSLFVIIIGWIVLIKGIITLLFPAFTASLYKKWVGHNVIIFTGLSTFIIGLIFVYVGIF